MTRIALIFLICACHRQVINPPSVAHRYGQMHELNGKRSGDGIVVTITDLTSGQGRLSRTNAAGEFEFPFVEGHYAFAATSAGGYVYVEQTIKVADIPSIDLSGNCYHVRGAVTGRIVHPVMVSFGRESNNVGDRFLVVVGSNGEFRACLPEGAYVARAENSMVSAWTPLTLHADSQLRIHAFAEADIKRSPANSSLRNVDFESFARSIADRMIIGLGEANHGTSEFYTYREKLSLDLARRGRLRCILVEADAIGMLDIDDYVMGKDIDIEKAVTALNFWITDTHEFLNFVAELRAYNARSEMSARVHLLGIDAQRLQPPVQYLLSRRETLGISDVEADLLLQLSTEKRGPRAERVNDNRTVLQALLERLDHPGRPLDITDAARISIAIRSIMYQLGYISNFGIVRDRDNAMAELAVHIIALGGFRQVALWAHDVHIAREPVVADQSLGQRLSAKFGANYVPIAFLSYTGKARAWDKLGTIGVVAHQLAATPSYNVESVIMQAAHFVDVAWVRFDAIGPPLKEWLIVPRFVREFGSIYDPDDAPILRLLPAAFTGVVVVQLAHPTTPTPTGVRTASP